MWTKNTFKIEIQNFFFKIQNKEHTKYLTHIHILKFLIKKFQRTDKQFK